MFTVIFAEKETIKLFEETKMFFGPLLDPDKVAFCEWHKNASTFDTMVPDLYSLIEYHSEWRALILYDDHIDKINPFDYTMYSEPYEAKEAKTWEFFEKRRSERFAAYERALENPLLKLTTGFCTSPNFTTVIDDPEIYNLLITGEMKTYEYMLRCQLNAINCGEAAARLDKYQRDSLRKYVDESNADRLIEFVKRSNVSGILELISDTDILGFIRFIGNDPIYFDPEYTECMIENTKRSYLYRSVARYFSMKDKLPREVICVSPRTFDFETPEQNIKWKNKDEHAYSRFSEFNLYHEKLKYLLFDILPVDNKQYKFDQIKFMCLLLLLAENDLPQGLVNASHVYRLNIDFDNNIVTRICERYISKLKATELHLKEIEYQIVKDSDVKVDDSMAQRLFESDVEINVKINPERQVTDLYADYKGLGLSTDCPGDEKLYWSDQYRNISKSFVRYMREPKRAVKYAATEELRRNNSINDDRALLLSENQIEDVKYHLYEEEQKMVDSRAQNIFDMKRFNDDLQEADKDIRRAIEVRMTRKKTVCAGLLATLAYLIGFMPLIFSNLNTLTTTAFSLIMTGGVVFVFVIVGIVYLFVLRNRLKQRFKNFNSVMGGICSTVNSSLAGSSKYLGCVCNVMRDFSVLKKKESSVTRLKKVLAYHDMRIKEHVEGVHNIFSKYVDFSKITVKECDPYDHDFTVFRDYEYEMPNIHSNKKIEFLQKGNEVIIPIDYVEAVTLTREEFYD